MNEELLVRFSELVVEVAWVQYTKREGIEQYRARLLLADGSSLRVSEIRVDGQLSKYSYYWLDERNELIAG